MKQLITLLLIGIFFGNVWAQCPNDYIILSSQQEVDDFATNYPGCTAALNDVIIGSFWEDTDVISLEEMSQLTSVNGRLIIVSTNLTDLSGLENLMTINGDLNIKYNDKLINLMVFENLIAINGKLEIDDNDVLTSLAGLENIDYTMITELNIVSNVNLAVCDLSNICTYLENDGAANIYGNTFGCSNQTEVEQVCMDIPPGDCPPGDVVLQTQAQVDAFVANYPNCTMTNGGLCICDDVNDPTIIDISDLSGLTHIGANLTISGVLDLSSLNGLEQVEAIGGDLRFDGLWDRNTPLDISALDHAITIGGVVYFGDVNHPIPQIAPCGVQAICDHYFISPNNVVSIYDACMPLDLVCTSPPTDCPTSDVLIGSQAQADNFIQLYPNCTELDVSLIFNDPEQVLDVTTGFANIKKITGDIRARACEVTGTFMALDTLWGSISAWVGSGVNNTYADGDMEASFPNLKYISETLEAYYNPEGYVSVACSLPELTRIEGGFDACNRGVNCVNCVNLEYIGGDILVPVGGLNYVDTIMGTIDYKSCNYENNISSPTSGFDELKYLGGSLRIGGDPLESFGSITGFQQLNTIVGSFYCFNDFNYTGNDYEITGLGQLKHAGSISINYYRLGNLNFLSQLESIDGGLSLIGNNRLTDISGLDHNISIGEEVYFKDNPQLSECAVQAVCDHINANGMTTITNNVVGCNSVTEVETACTSFLPIEMATPFRVYLNNKTAILQWRTATEVNNAGFEIQRSKDGIQWQRIGWQAGQGNSLTPHSYTYRDENPLLGTSYYRLKHVDFNGDFAYSNIVTLQYTRPGITIFPNPNTGIFNVQATTTQSTYKILNTSGQIIQIGKLKNDTPIDISSEAQGVYFISIQIENEILTKRMVKL